LKPARCRSETPLGCKQYPGAIRGKNAGGGECPNTGQDVHSGSASVPRNGAADANFEASNNFLTVVKIVNDTPTTDRRFGEPVPPLGA
jgi:hypothetical protein